MNNRLHSGYGSGLNAKRINFIVDVIYFGIIAMGFYLIVKYAVPLIIPFIIAFAVAAMLQKPARLLHKRIKKVSQGAWFAILAIICYLIVGTGAVLLSVWLVGQFLELLKNLPELVSTGANATLNMLKNWADDLPDQFGDPLREWLDSISNDLTGALTSFVADFSGPIIGTVGVAANVAAAVPGFLVNLLFAVVSTFFIGVDYQGFKKMLLNFFPKSTRPVVSHIKKFSVDTVLSLIKTYAFLMFLTFAELGVGLAIISLCGGNIPYLVPLALIIAFVDILPVLGVGTVLIPWAIISFFNSDWGMGIGLLILWIIIIVVRNFLEPKLVGGRFGLHPVMTMLAIYVGGALFGFIGVFVLPLSLVITKRLWDSGAFSVFRGIRKGKATDEVADAEPEASDK